MNTRELEEKTTIRFCGEACSNSTDCCSFQFSPSREICGFNKGCVPTHVQFQDNICCIPNEKGGRSQFFPGIIFIVTEICDQPSSIVTSSEYDEDTTGENVLSDCNDETSDRYWKAPTGRTGSEAELVLELGCMIRMEHISLRNGFGDFGTTKYSLWGARSKRNPWVLLHNGTLSNIGESVSLI